MVRKRSDFWEVRLFGKLCVNFRSDTVKDTLRAIELFAKYNFPFEHQVKLVLSASLKCLCRPVHESSPYQICL